MLRWALMIVYEDAEPLSACVRCVRDEFGKELFRIILPQSIADEGDRVSSQVDVVQCFIDAQVLNPNLLCKFFSDKVMSDDHSIVYASDQSFIITYASA